MIQAHADTLKTITANDFLMLGHGDIAYIKPSHDEQGNKIYAIHAADGTPVAGLPDATIARNMAEQHDLIVMDVQ